MAGFGLGVGDFIAVARNTKDLRKTFADAPAQFRSLSGDIRNLWAVLDEIRDISRSRDELPDEHKERLKEIS